MTTIAYRDGIMAADSQVTVGGFNACQSRKIIKLKDGSLLGGAGSIVSTARIMRFMEEHGEITELVIGASPDCGMIYVRPEGTVWIIEGGKRGGMAQVEGLYFAEGSGTLPALVAMRTGMSAVKAVEVAAEFDTATALPVVSLRLGKAGRKRK